MSTSGVQDLGPSNQVTGTVTANQGTSPWVVSGTVTTTGTVTANQGTSPWVVSGTVTATEASVGTNGATAPTSSNQVGGVDQNGKLQPITTKTLGTQVTSTDQGLVTNSVIHGLTTGGGGGYVDVKVNPSGALSTSIGDVSGIVGQATMANSIPVTIASNQTNTPYAIRLDNTSTANVTYIGKAAVASLTASAVWQIQRIDQTTGLIVTWAAGSAAFTNIWDNRTSLSYS